MSSPAGASSSDTRKLLGDAEASLNRLLSNERDAMRLGSLKRARQNLDNAKKSLQSDLSSADLSLARALKVIEDYLPADDLEERRLYLVEGIKRFKSAGWRTDATELEARLGKLAVPSPPKTPEPEKRIPERQTVKFSEEIRNSSGEPTVEELLKLLETCSRTGRSLELDEKLTDDKKWGRNFLIAIFDTNLSASQLFKVIYRPDKATTKAIRFLRSLKEDGVVEYDPASAERVDVDYLIKNILIPDFESLPPQENKRTETYPFLDSDGKEVSIIRETTLDSTEAVTNVRYSLASHRGHTTHG